MNEITENFDKKKKRKSKTTAILKLSQEFEYESFELYVDSKLVLRYDSGKFFDDFGNEWKDSAFLKQYLESRI